MTATDLVNDRRASDGPSRAGAPSRVVIVIVSYHSAEDIRRCLQAVDRSTHQAFGIVICENGGPEAFGRLKRTIPHRLSGGQPIEFVLADDNLGYAGAINLCLDHAPDAQAYWILNPDTQPEPTALAAMMARLARQDVGAVGHDLVLPDGNLASLAGGQWRSWSAQAISIDHGRPRTGDVDPAAIEADLDYIVGASMLIDAGFLARVGRMREDYFLYCEEVEWCLRAARQGERFGYAPDALVLHAHGTSTGGGGELRTRSRLAVYLTERNRILLTRDLFPKRLLAAAPLSLAHILVRYARERAWRQLGYAVSGWFAGLREERGKPSWFKNAARPA